jgi:hypothetical protein
MAYNFTASIEDGAFLNILPIYQLELRNEIKTLGAYQMDIALI